MELNPTKYKKITFKRKKNIYILSIISVTFQLQKHNKWSIIGVILDCKLYFKKHIGYITNKVKQTVGFVKRYSKDLNSTAVKTLYTYLIRSHLRYASIIWDPVFNIDILNIEKVQDQFCRYTRL